MGRDIRVARLFIDLESDTKGLQNEMERAERSLGRITTFIQKNPITAIASLGAAAVAAGLKLAQMAMPLETSMAQLKVLTGATESEIKGFRDGVVQLFREMPVNGLDELTRGLNEIVAAGIPAGDALEFLRIAAEAAVGGTTSTDIAVRGLTAAVNAFTTQGLTAADAADVMAVTVDKGNLSFEELSSGMGRVVGAAAGLGVRFDEIGTSIAAMTLNGLSADESFTSLSAILSNIAKPTEALLRDYPELAKQFDLTALRTKGLVQFMAELAPLLKGNDDATIKMFGSQRALNAVLGFTADGGVRLSKIHEEMTDRAGASSRAYDIMSETTENLYKILKNQFNAELIKLGTEILPLVNRGLSAAVDFMRFLFNDNANDIAQRSAVATIQSLGGALSNMTLVSRAAPEAIDRVKEALSGLFLEAAGGGRGDLKKLADQDLVALKEGLTGIVNSAAVSKDELRFFNAALKEVSERIEAKGGLDELKGSIKGVGDSAAGAAPPATDLAGGLGNVGDAGKKAGDEAKKAAKELADLRAEMADTFAKTTRSLIDDTALAIQRFEERAKKVKMPKADMDAFTQAMREQGEALELVRITALYTTETLASPDPARELENVRRVTQRLFDELKKVKVNGEAYNTLLAELNRLKLIEIGLEDRIVALKEEQRDLNDDAIAQGVADIRNADLSVKRKQELLAELLGITEEQAKQLLQQDAGNAKTRTMAEQVATIARGTLDLAQAFGVVDARAASALNSVITIGENIGKAMGGDPTAIIGVIGSAANLLNTMFGETPQAAERKRILKENSDRLLLLAQRTGDLVDAMSSGNTLAGVGEALSTVLKPGLFDGFNPLNESMDKFLRRQLNPVLQSLGLTMEDLEQAAKDFGIEIAPNGQLNANNLFQLLQAIREADTGAGSTFSGRLKSLDDSLAFGVTSRDQEFAKLLGLTGDSAIGRALEGLSPDMPGFRGMATEILKKLFGDLESGALSLADLGGMSRSQFSAMIGRLLGILASDQAIGPETPTTPPTEIVEPEEPPPPPPPPPDPTKEKATRDQDSLIRDLMSEFGFDSAARGAITKALSAGLVTQAEADELIRRIREDVLDAASDDEAAAYQAAADAAIAALEADLEAGRISESRFEADRQKVLDTLAANLGAGLTTDEALALADPFAARYRDFLLGITAVEESVDEGFASLAAISAAGNDYLDGILAELASFEPVAPPVLSRSQLNGGTAPALGGVTINGGINLTVNMLPGEQLADPAVVERHTSLLLDQLDEALARRLSDASILRGDPRRP